MHLTLIGGTQGKHCCKGQQSGRSFLVKQVTCTGLWDGLVLHRPGPPHGKTGAPVQGGLCGQDPRDGNSCCFFCLDPTFPVSSWQPDPHWGRTSHVEAILA